jgi:hypothetical protein
LAGATTEGLEKSKRLAPPLDDEYARDVSMIKTDLVPASGAAQVAGRIQEHG